MPRPPRIEFPDAVYHVMAGGNRREPIVLGDEDRLMMLRCLAELAGRAGFRIHAYALIAQVLAERTSVRLEWIVEHLRMGTKPYVSRLASQKGPRVQRERKLERIKSKIA